MPKITNYLLIGDGRLANHLRHYFDLLGLSFDTWSRSVNTENDLDAKALKAHRILLLISDDSIESFANIHLKSHLHQQSINKMIIHCSGTLTCKNIIGAHPLQSFVMGHRDALDEYEQVCFFYESNKHFDFADILPDLTNPSYAIDTDKKSYYHALCVGANNFTTILWQSFAKRMLEEFDVPFEKLQYYLNTTTKNIEKDIDTALTGPFIRNDKCTIENNLSSLVNDDFKLIYKAFLDFYNQEKKSNLKIKGEL